ncbi:vesicle-trafficking protein SEC22b-like isoform X2 [Ptychodera flava]|uniref:vesicle-trafficking protein SEC22b-like isoform X2 n=1 Tax=Ptychodera flava TaxID=63121 RepID=UPI00396A0A0A
MVLLTMIARVKDGLILTASIVQENEQNLNITDYQNQAKMLFRKLDDNSPIRCSIETGSMMFHYLIDKAVCYLVLCERAYPKKLAYTYLDDLQNEFHAQYGRRVSMVSRPYGFIEFDACIQRIKKPYMDARSRRHVNVLNSELQDVQRIMVQNIDDVLARGVALSVLDDKASNLSTLSKKYRQDAKYLNLRSTHAKIAAIVVIIIMLLVYIRYWWF